MGKPSLVVLKWGLRWKGLPLCMVNPWLKPFRGNQEKSKVYQVQFEVFACLRCLSCSNHGFCYPGDWYLGIRPCSRGEFQRKKTEWPREELSSKPHLKIIPGRFPVRSWNIQRIEIWRVGLKIEWMDETNLFSLLKKPHLENSLEFGDLNLKPDSGWNRQGLFPRQAFHGQELQWFAQILAFCWNWLDWGNSTRGCFDLPDGEIL